MKALAIKLIFLTLSLGYLWVFINGNKPVSHIQPLYPQTPVATPVITTPATTPPVVPNVPITHKAPVTNIPNVVIQSMPDVTPHFSTPQYSTPAPTPTSDQTIHNGSLY